ncbi:MAG: hypothetical protein RL328_1493 [Acidobacteriota bacterium]|jgi:hypothetical protein
MSQLSKLSPKEKAQTGMILIKAAIGEILLENQDRWIGRNQIEEALGLWSEYGSGTYGAVASMFLDELVKEGDIIAQRQPDGRTWVYRTAVACAGSSAR